MTNLFGSLPTAASLSSDERAALCRRGARHCTRYDHLICTPTLQVGCWSSFQRMEAPQVQTRRRQSWTRTRGPSEFPMVRHLGALAMETQQWVAVGATREWGSNGSMVELGMAKSGVWTRKPTRLPGNLATKEPGLSCSGGVGLRPSHR